MTSKKDNPDLFEVLKDQKPKKVVEQLAKLSKLDAEEQSKKICKYRGWTTKTLREEISAVRFGNDVDETSSRIVEDLTPAENPVAGRDLAETIHDMYRDHLKVGEHDYTTLTLWTLLTYCYDDFIILTKLLINSPQKRCGKTTLLEVLEALVYKGLLVSGVSAAVIYRVVELRKPCLLLDEADAYMKHDETMRGIVNAGHKKRSANVLKCSGDDSEPKNFSTWSPMAIAGIGGQATTIHDRSVIISMRRKLPAEKVHKLDLQFFEQKRILRMQLLRWAEDKHKKLRSAKPEMPTCNNDRATDNWHPLFCIAEVLGGDWPEKTAAAFEEAALKDVDEDASVMLLQDLKAIFDGAGTARLHSNTIVLRLVEMEGRPWPEWRRGSPLTANSLARLLKPYEIKSKQMKIAGVNKHGYTVENIQDAFDRYITPVSTATSILSSDSKRLPVAEGVSFQGTQKPTKATGKATPKRKPRKVRSKVADENRVEASTKPAVPDVTREVDTSYLGGGK